MGKEGREGERRKLVRRQWHYPEEKQCGLVQGADVMKEGEKAGMTKFINRWNLR